MKKCCWCGKEIPDKTIWADFESDDGKRYPFHKPCLFKAIEEGQKEGPSTVVMYFQENALQECEKICQKKDSSKN